jgi:DNA-directed RNA polymerase specialized sigma24 family protein
MKTDSDAIVAMARKLMADGSSAVEEELATAIFPVAKAMAFRRTGRFRADFDDLVQEAVWALIVQLRARQLQDENSVLGYLGSIVANILHSEYRRTWKLLAGFILTSRSKKEICECSRNYRYAVPPRKIAH